MDAALLRSLNDKDKRKAAALEVERLIRDALSKDDTARVGQLIHQLCELCAAPSVTTRNGGLMGIAGAAIAFGPTTIAPYLSTIMQPIITGMADADSKVRYFACESLYNVAKVAKGEILPFFSELFDVLSKLVADSERTICNSAELIDRLLKDIVVEQAATYVSALALEAPEPGLPTLRPGDDQPSTMLPDVPGDTCADRAFSLERFIPLLTERIHVLNPYTRTFLVNWLATLDSVPELELVSHLPAFLDGLLRYISDVSQEIRNLTMSVLADFLDSIRTAAEVARAREEAAANRRANGAERARRASVRPVDATALHPDEVTPPDPDQSAIFTGDDGSTEPDELEPDADDDGTGLGTWEPGQGVVVDHAAIVDTLLAHLRPGYDADPDVQRTCLGWISEFLHFAEPVMLPVTPRLISVILPTLAHHVPQLCEAARSTNATLSEVIYNLPVSSAASRDLRSRTSSTESSSPVSAAVPFPSSGVRSPERPIESLDSLALGLATGLGPAAVIEEEDLLDYPATVAALMEQLVPDQEETRLACLKWLLMLHQKAPRKVMSMHDGTFPALLKLLSEQSISEDVIKADLHLITQISSASEDEYFTSFIRSLLNLFRSDTALLEKRGSLIVRQLCNNLRTERIYRTFAEILEHDDELEFASVMVQNLNLIVITSPELADFRRRLKNLDTKDGQALFTSLYRSWSHNAVAAFSLCLLAQAYEHASNLLQIFAELEITVSMLIQVDKLVQLLESPVFTSLRLQLLEPDRYPYLFKALYGLLMLLPQSSAFATLRNRLNAVSTLGFMHVMPRTSTPAAASGPSSAPASGRAGLRRADDSSIQWKDLLAHFRSVQSRHEKQRRQTIQQMGSGVYYDTYDSAPTTASFASPPVTGGISMSISASQRGARRKTGGGSVVSRSTEGTRGGGDRTATKRSPPQTRPLSPGASVTSKRTVSTALPRR